jgi:hypothetical protein
MHGQEYLQLAVAPATVSPPERIVSVPSRDMGKTGDENQPFFFLLVQFPKSPLSPDRTPTTRSRGGLYNILVRNQHWCREKLNATRYQNLSGRQGMVPEHSILGGGKRPCAYTPIINH